MNLKGAVLFSLVVGLTGCGKIGKGTEDELTLQCEVDGMTIKADDSIDCAKVASDVKLAKGIILAAGLATQDEIDAGFKSLDIRSWDVYALDCETAVGDYCAVKVFGEHTFFDDGTHFINLEWSGRKLLHEMLHQIEYTKTGKTTNHEEWNKNGYYAASDKFESKHEAWR